MALHDLMMLRRAYEGKTRTSRDQHWHPLSCQPVDQPTRKLDRLIIFHSRLNGAHAQVARGAIHVCHKHHLLHGHARRHQVIGVKVPAL